MDEILAVEYQHIVSMSKCFKYYGCVMVHCIFCPIAKLLNFVGSSSWVLIAKGENCTKIATDYSLAIVA